MKNPDEMSDDEINDWFANVEAVAQEHGMTIKEYFASLPQQLARVIARGERNREIVDTLIAARGDREQFRAVWESLTPDERERVKRALEGTNESER